MNRAEPHVPAKSEEEEHQRETYITVDRVVVDSLDAGALTVQLLAAIAAAYDGVPGEGMVQK